MNTTITLFGFYLAAIFAASLLGGWLPRRFQLTHTRTQLIMSLVAGLMLGVAFFHLIPHSALTPPVDVDFTMLWSVMGLVFMLVLLRLFHFHQHDFALAGDTCDHGDADAHSHTHAHDHGHVSAPSSPFTWFGLLLGLSVHTIVDGIALGAVMRAEPTGGGVLGLGVFLAILLHKPLDSLSIETVMIATGQSSLRRRWINVGFSLLCPLAALVFWSAVDPTLADSLLLSAALAFSAGAFICIALGDLLPEIQFHSHDRGKLTGLFLLGLGLAWAIGLVEGAH